MQSKMTLIGLNNYLSDDENPHVLFKYLSLPENTLDKETLIDTILMRGGEMEVQYADPDFTQYLMKSWSRKYANTIQRWYDAFNKEYNPIHNYDRHEQWTENKEGSHADNSTGNSTADTDSTTTGLDSSTDEHKVSAYNSSSYEPSSQDIHNGNNSVTEDNTTSSEFETDNSGTYDEDLTHEGHLFGNIGVMSTQEMIEKEFELYMIDLYDDVADLFLHDFVIPVS